MICCLPNTEASCSVLTSKSCFDYIIKAHIKGIKIKTCVRMIATTMTPSFI